MEVKNTQKEKARLLSETELLPLKNIDREFIPAGGSHGPALYRDPAHRVTVTESRLCFARG